MRLRRPKPVFLSQLVGERAEPEPFFIAMEYRAENLRQSRVDVRGGLARAMLERQIGSAADQHVEEAAVGERRRCKQGGEYGRDGPALRIGYQRLVNETFDRSPREAFPKFFVFGLDVLASGVTRNRNTKQTEAFETAIDRRLVCRTRHMKENLQPICRRPVALGSCMHEQP